jgi:hypothetical protein
MTALAFVGLPPLALAALAPHAVTRALQLRYGHRLVELGYGPEYLPDQLGRWASAISRSVRAPARLISRMIGSTVAACRAAAASFATEAAL